MNSYTRKRLFSTAFGIVQLVVAGWAQSDIITSRIAKDSIKTEHGYTILNHTNKPGIKPVAGDMVAVHVSLWINDTLLQDTRKIAADPREIQIPDFREMPEGHMVPLVPGRK